MEPEKVQRRLKSNKMGNPVGKKHRNETNMYFCLVLSETKAWMRRFEAQQQPKHIFNFQEYKCQILNRT